MALASLVACSISLEAPVVMEWKISSSAAVSYTHLDVYTSQILAPVNRDMLGHIYATEALLGLDDYCMEYIGAYREGIIGPEQKK